MVGPEAGEVQQYETKNGVNFLIQNEAMSLKFMAFFGMHQCSKFSVGNRFKHNEHYSV